MNYRTPIGQRCEDDTRIIARKIAPGAVNGILHRAREQCNTHAAAAYRRPASCVRASMFFLMFNENDVCENPCVKKKN